MSISLEDLLKFMPQISSLLKDQTVSEIMHNGDGKVFVERNGMPVQCPEVELDQSTLLIAIQTIARALNTDFNDERPLLDGRLDDGSRVAAVLDPVSQGGITLNIRKFDSRRFVIDELVRIGSIAQPALDCIRGFLRAEKNVLISGGTSTGKTTLLNALSPDLGSGRIVLIEDTPEVQLHQQNVVRMVSKREAPEVTIRDLLKMAMRLRPDRIVLGEVRGAEAFDLLQALNSGHGGSMATIHAQDAKRAIAKLGMYVMQSGDVPFEVVRPLLAESIDLIVQLERNGSTGKRYVSEVIELVEFEQETGTFVYEEWWTADGQDNREIPSAEFSAR